MSESYFFYKQKFIRKELCGCDNIIQWDVIPYNNNFFENIISNATNKQINLTIKADHLFDYEYNFDDEEEFYDNPDFDWFLCDRIHYHKYNSDDDKLLDELHIELNENSPYWNIVFKNIKNINIITIDTSKKFNDYNWMNNVNFIKLGKHSICTSIIFYSGKLLETNYEPWMNVENYPNILYKIDHGLRFINPNIQKLYINIYVYDDIVENLLKQLKYFNNLNELHFCASSNTNNLIKYFLDINCNVLYFNNKYLDDIVALNKYKCIRSIFSCKKETVNNNYTIIDGWFDVENEEENYLEKIIDRNRSLNTKSAKNI